VLWIGRSWVQCLMMTLDFSVDLILPVAPWPRNLLGVEGQLTLKANNHTAICELAVSRKYEMFGVSQKCRPPRPVYRDNFTSLPGEQVYVIIRGSNGPFFACNDIRTRTTRCGPYSMWTLNIFRKETSVHGIKMKTIHLGKIVI
jgi:hypothetical protein